jgi:hypothetical protein
MEINSELLKRQLYFTNPEPDVAEAFDRVFSTGSISKTYVCPVLDAIGNPLEKDGIYKYRDIHIKVRKWEFGGGNLLDRYYRVFYTDSVLKDSFLVVNAKYPSGVFGGAVYCSGLEYVKTH